METYETKVVGKVDRMSFNLVRAFSTLVNIGRFALGSPFCSGFGYSDVNSPESVRTFLCLVWVLDEECTFLGSSMASQCSCSSTNHLHISHISWFETTSAKHAGCFTGHKTFLELSVVTKRDIKLLLPISLLLDAPTINTCKTRFSNSHLFFTMRFSLLTILAGLTSLATAQMSATAIVTNIDILTTKSQSLFEPAKQLSITNAPLLIIGQGPWPVSLPPFPPAPHKQNARPTSTNTPPQKPESHPRLHRHRHHLHQLHHCHVKQPQVYHLHQPRRHRHRQRFPHFCQSPSGAAGGVDRQGWVPGSRLLGSPLRLC